MQGSKINRDQQIQVVIRLKPHLEDHSNQTHYTKCVSTSPHDPNELIVQTQNKREYFVFDNVANESCSQQGIYEQIGREMLHSATQGFNCCIFAYGQTGAGKTYSILGRVSQLANDIYAQSRGILPRLLNEVFDWLHFSTENSSVICSYMEIYNQQIFDLLNTEVKVRQIRQDFKRGVFVDGISQQKAKNYESAMEILLRGQKNRRVGATSMNAESSRSHTIFTINLDFEIIDKETSAVKHRKAKINIVDLAGSQRAKQAKVEGERLKQGCNINKSLHVLGNVINALVQSTKKKKHIPFRDSKLTYYLKDSLSGNSITKLLANIEPNKKYISDTLSTLMFAKRAKIIRMKVQANENLLVTENFEVLRKQIKQLRQQLAQARYLKNNESKSAISQDKNSLDGDQDGASSTNWDKVLDPEGFDLTKNEKIIQVFEQNETNFKALIEIYEQHMKTCLHSKQVQEGQQRKKAINFHHEWKLLEKKNTALTGLIKNMPAFTRIFKENLLLKKDLQNKREGKEVKEFFSKTVNLKGHPALELKRIDMLMIHDSFGNQKPNNISQQVLDRIISQYEKLLEQVECKVKQRLEVIENQYDDLIRDSHEKDLKIKELKRKKQYPPQLEALINENEYLKLNVLQLQSEISQLQEKQLKSRALRRSISLPEQPKQDHHLYLSQQISGILLNLQQVKAQALSQLQEFQKERQQAFNYIELLRKQLIRTTEQNKNLTKENQFYRNSNEQLANKITEGSISKDRQTSANNTHTFWTNSQWSEDSIQHLAHGQDRNKLTVLLQKEQQKRNNLQKLLQTEHQKSVELSNQIMKLHQEYGRQIAQLKYQMRKNESQRKQYKGELQTVKIKQHLIEQEFGKSLSDVLDSYRETVRQPYSPRLGNTTSIKSLYNVPLTQRNSRKNLSRQKSEIKQQHIIRKKPLMKSSTVIPKKEVREKQKEPLSKKIQKTGNIGKIKK